MAYALTPEQYQQLNKLDPLVRDEVFASQELNPDFTGITASFAEIGKQFKISAALDAFNDPTGKKIKAYTTELGNTGMKFTARDVALATNDAKKTEAKLQSLESHRVKTSLPENSGFWYNASVGNQSATFEELTKQIGVNTGQDISDFTSKALYKKAIKTSLESLKKGLPKDLYEERKDIVWNAWTSIFRRHEPVPGEAPRPAPGNDYFDFKQDDTTADNILKGMFEDPEMYELWLEESE